MPRHRTGITPHRMHNSLGTPLLRRLTSTPLTQPILPTVARSQVCSRASGICVNWRISSCHTQWCWGLGMHKHPHMERRSSAHRRRLPRTTIPTTDVFPVSCLYLHCSIVHIPQILQWNLSSSQFGYRFYSGRMNSKAHCIIFKTECTHGSVAGSHAITIVNCHER